MNCKDCIFHNSGVFQHQLTLIWSSQLNRQYNRVEHNTATWKVAARNPLFSQGISSKRLIMHELQWGGRNSGKLTPLGESSSSSISEDAIDLSAQVIGQRRQSSNGSEKDARTAGWVARQAASLMREENPLSDSVVSPTSVASHVGKSSRVRSEGSSPTGRSSSPKGRRQLFNLSHVHMVESESDIKCMVLSATDVDLDHFQMGKRGEVDIYSPIQCLDQLYAQVRFLPQCVSHSCQDLVTCTWPEIIIYKQHTQKI